jgi:16S rRNA (adenine1518-N6/adenine1519-N6)-dimethyltransferase
VTRTAARPHDLADLDTARGVARRSGLVLKGRLGQHLLVDRAVLDAVVAALNCGSEDDVLEVGPGIGTLTVELARRARRVIAVELDPVCARATRRSVAGIGDVSVVDGDVLAQQPSELGLGPGWLAAGNIPYTITGALLAHLLERADPPARAVLLVQREVAARLAAAAGDWSLSTVAIRSIAAVERLLDVPPAAFDPPPAVWSSLLRLTPRREYAEAERGAMLALARPAFQMRRKMLRHGLTRACGGDEQLALALLADAGIDAHRRPGELDLAEWAALARAREARR